MAAPQRAALPMKKAASRLREAAFFLADDQVIRAIRMISGIGTPRNHSRSERMSVLLYQLSGAVVLLGVVR
jgi:hypothetical protein